MIMKKVKSLVFLLSLCIILLCCTDKKPVSQAQESSVQQEDSVPVKKVDNVKVAKMQPLTYKILVPFNNSPLNFRSLQSFYPKANRNCSRKET